MESVPWLLLINSCDRPRWLGAASSVLRLGMKGGVTVSVTLPDPVETKPWGLDKGSERHGASRNDRKVGQLRPSRLAKRSRSREREHESTHEPGCGGKRGDNGQREEDEGGRRREKEEREREEGEKKQMDDRTGFSEGEVDMAGDGPTCFPSRPPWLPNEEKRIWRGIQRKTHKGHKNQYILRGEDESSVTWYVSDWGGRSNLLILPVVGLCKAVVRWVITDHARRGSR